MGLVSRWAGAALCAGVVAMAGSEWFGRAVAVAQQPAPAAAPAPAGMRGDPAHGRYLVERVAMCGECHSTRTDAGDIVAALRLRGGRCRPGALAGRLAGAGAPDRRASRLFRCGSAAGAHLRRHQA